MQKQMNPNGILTVATVTYETTTINDSSASKISTKPRCASCGVACDPWPPREIARSIPLEVQVVWQVLRYSLAEPKRMSLRLEHKKTISHHPHNHLKTWQLPWFSRSKLPSWLILHSFDTRVPSPKKNTPWSPDPLDDSHSLTWKRLANLQNFLIGIGVPTSTNNFAKNGKTYAFRWEKYGNMHNNINNLYLNVYPCIPSKECFTTCIQFGKSLRPIWSKTLISIRWSWVTRQTWVKSSKPVTWIWSHGSFWRVRDCKNTIMLCFNFVEGNKFT